MRGNKRITRKERYNEFWDIGAKLMESGMAIADLYRYFSRAEEKPPQERADESKRKALTLTEERRKEIEEFAGRTSNGEFTVFRELPKMIAPYIAGNEEMKLALCYSLASNYEKPIHLLFIGNPASVKSDLLTEVKDIFPEAVLGGPRSTEAGLTIDTLSGSPGLLILANHGLALIDEMDKIKKSEINATYEALESGRISVNTGKVKGEYETKFTCIAAANPKGGVFGTESMKMREQIEAVIPPPLLSRFHLVFLLRKESKEKVEDAIKLILTRKEKSNPNREFIRDYFDIIRRRSVPVEYDFDKDSPLIKEMSQFVVDALSRSERNEICIPLTKRAAEALKRVSISSARLRMSRRVEEVDVRNALGIMETAFKTAADI